MRTHRFDGFTLEKSINKSISSFEHFRSWHGRRRRYGEMLNKLTKRLAND